MHELNSATNESHEFLFSYNAQNRLKDIKKMRDFGGSPFAIGTAEFQWDGQNLSKTKNNLELGIYDEISYQYTSKPNQLKKLFEQEANFYSLDPEYLSESLLVAYKSDFKSKTYKVDYINDENDRLIQKTTSEIIDNKWTVIETVSYNYWD